MNHKYVEDARQVVILQANVLEKLACRENTSPDERASLKLEVKRLRLLAAKLCEVRNSLDTPTSRAMKNWKPPTHWSRG